VWRPTRGQEEAGRRRRVVADAGPAGEGEAGPREEGGGGSGGGGDSAGTGKARGGGDGGGGWPAARADREGGGSAGDFQSVLARKGTRVGARVGQPNPHFYRLGAGLGVGPSNFFEGLRV
jgi:hypothetical protein